MYRIGADITSISRIKDSAGRPGFCKKVFSAGELAAFRGKEGVKYRSLAANFAAKEAFSKALGTGVRGFSLREVEVLRDGLGAPYFNFYGRAAEIVKNSGLSFSVSLSHEGDTAMAVVIARPFQSGDVDV